MTEIIKRTTEDYKCPFCGCNEFIEIQNLNEIFSGECPVDFSGLVKLSCCSQCGHSDFKLNMDAVRVIEDRQELLTAKEMDYENQKERARQRLVNQRNEIERQKKHLDDLNYSLSNPLISDEEKNNIEKEKKQVEKSIKSLEKRIKGKEEHL